MRKRRAGGPFVLAALALAVWLCAPGCGGSGDNCADASDAAPEVIVVEDVSSSPGNVQVHSSFVDCPTITGITVPDQIVVGDSAAVGAVISTTQGAPTPTLKWTSTTGTFLNPGQATTLFTCIVPGPTTVTLTLNATGQCHDSLGSVIRCTLEDGGY
jgi:hypothetical protein